MLELSRTVRLCLNAPGSASNLAAEPRSNTYAAWPPPRGLARYLEVRVVCRGEADPRTGYFINIRDIDEAVRNHGLPRLLAAVDAERTGTPAPLGRLLHDLLIDLQPPLNNTAAAVELRLTPVTTMTATPIHSERVAVNATGETSSTLRVLIRQRYEFSAAHRLHVPEYSDQQNRDIFGKCNNLAGHGHNYAFEVAVECPVDRHGHALDIAELDAIVDRHAVDRLDHTHLNHDVPEFADRNPSVEHIAPVIWDYLVDELPRETALREVTVWETGKTSCTYRGTVSSAV